MCVTNLPNLVPMAYTVAEIWPFLGRLFDRVDLIKPVSNVCPSVRRCVRPSVLPKSFFDFNEIWHVGRGQRVMHDGMQYDPIQG